MERLRPPPPGRNIDEIMASIKPPENIQEPPAGSAMITNNAMPDTESSFQDTDVPQYICQMEKLYPETAIEFRQIQHEQYELFARKMLDYSPGNILLGGNIDKESDRIGSLRGIVIRLNDKINRLLTIVVKGNANNNESITDTFMDTSIYGIIALIVQRVKWGK